MRSRGIRRNLLGCVRNCGTWRRIGRGGAGLKSFERRVRGENFFKSFPPVNTCLRLFLCLILSFAVLAACAAPQRSVKLGPIDSGSLTDGVFRGESRVGPVVAVVDVAVRNGAITRIDVIRHMHMLGGAANPTVPERIIAAQSTDVDAVSGATGSSIALMQAVQDALDASRAGGEKAPE